MGDLSKIMNNTQLDQTTSPNKHQLEIEKGFSKLLEGYTVVEPELIGQYEKSTTTPVPGEETEFKDETVQLHTDGEVHDPLDKFRTLYAAHLAAMHNIIGRAYFSMGGKTENMSELFFNLNNHANDRSHGNYTNDQSDEKTPKEVLYDSLGSFQGKTENFRTDWFLPAKSDFHKISEAYTEIQSDKNNIPIENKESYIVNGANILGPDRLEVSQLLNLSNNLSANIRQEALELMANSAGLVSAHMEALAKCGEEYNNIAEDLNKMRYEYADPSVEGPLNLIKTENLVFYKNAQKDWGTLRDTAKAMAQPQRDPGTKQDFKP